MCGGTPTGRALLGSIREQWGFGVLSGVRLRSKRRDHDSKLRAHVKLDLYMFDAPSLEFRITGFFGSSIGLNECSQRAAWA